MNPTVILKIPDSTIGSLLVRDGVSTVCLDLQLGHGGWSAIPSGVPLYVCIWFTSYLPELFCALDTSLTAYLAAKLQQSLHQSLFGTSIWFLLNAWHKNSHFISKPQDNHSPTQKKKACICNFICGIHVSSSALDSINHNHTSTFYYIQKVFGIPYLYPIIQRCCLISVNHISASSKSKQ